MIGILCAFLAGLLGVLMGGTETFIATGFLGLLVAAFSTFGMQLGWFQTYVVDLMFVPAIIFNSAAAATAVASKRNHQIEGTEVARSLAFTKDPIVFLTGGIVAVIGYFVFSSFNKMGPLLDTGAFTIVILSFIVRILLGKQVMNKKGIPVSKGALINMFSFQIVLAIIISFITVLITKYTGLYSLGFSISAFSLIMMFQYPNFPSTHQITMVAGYAYFYTGDIILSIIFGVLSQIVFTLFGFYFNYDCGTHIDPPAVSIALFSFIIFNFF